MFNRPIVKPMLVPFVNYENTGVRIGGFQHGIARDILVDEPEIFIKFLKYLDGNHTLLEIEKRFSLSNDELYQILTNLQKEGIIFEDDTSLFSEIEIELYSRSVNFYKWIDITGRYYNYWDVQRKLKESKVLVLGCGGTGSNVLINLAKMGIGNLTVVDCDKVELSNLNRQFFRIKDIGKPKEKVITEIIKELNPYVNIESFSKMINTTEDLVSIGTEYDVIMNCIDKPKEISLVVDDFSREFGIPWILGGYASTIVTQGLFDGKNVSFDELIEKNLRSFSSQQLANNTEWQWENAITSPVANISGSFSALYCMYLLTGLKTIKPGVVQHVDLYNIQDLENFSYIFGGGDD